MQTRYVLCFLLLAIGQTSAEGEGGSFSTNRGWLSITSDSGGTKLAAVVVERVQIWIFPSESFSRFPRVSIGFPLENQPCSLLPPISEKKNPNKSFQKVKIEKFQNKK